jgi:hypothetical protein
MLHVIILSHYAECGCYECKYAECHSEFLCGVFLHCHYEECHYVDWMQRTLIEWEVSVQLTSLYKLV